MVQEVVLKNGRPSAVILDIHTYRQLLERLDAVEDLAELRRLRKQKLHFRPFEEFLKSSRRV